MISFRRSSGLIGTASGTSQDTARCMHTVAVWTEVARCMLPRMIHRPTEEPFAATNTMAKGGGQRRCLKRPFVFRQMMLATDTTGVWKIAKMRELTRKRNVKRWLPGQ